MFRTPKRIARSHPCAIPSAPSTQCRPPNAGGDARDLVGMPACIPTSPTHNVNAAYGFTAMALGARRPAERQGTRCRRESRGWNAAAPRPIMAGAVSNPPALAQRVRRCPQSFASGPRRPWPSSVADRHGHRGCWADQPPGFVARALSQGSAAPRVQSGRKNRQRSSLAARRIQRTPPWRRCSPPPAGAAVPATGNVDAPGC